jgi:DNA-directed RNA polymerase subunit K/omega
VNNSYLERAKKVITDPQILSIVAGKRARQLAWGARPMLKCDTANHLDIALLEIAEGKLYYTHGDKNAEVDIFAKAAEDVEAAPEVKKAKKEK